MLLSLSPKFNDVLFNLFTWTFVHMTQLPVVDPDLEIRGGGWCSFVLLTQPGFFYLQFLLFLLKSKGAGGAPWVPWASPLDLPLIMCNSSSFLVFSKAKDMLIPILAIQFWDK